MTRDLKCFCPGCEDKLLPSPRHYRSIIVTGIVLAVVLLLGPAAVPDRVVIDNVHHGEPDQVRAALDYASREWGVSRSAMAKVSHCESTWNPNASNRGRYLGLFQHKSSSWRGRVAAFNRHVELHNSREPNRLEPMAGVWNAPIDQSRLTAAYVAGVLPGYRGGWSWWQCKP